MHTHVSVICTLPPEIIKLPKMSICGYNIRINVMVVMPKFRRHLLYYLCINNNHFVNTVFS